MICPQFFLARQAEDERITAEANEQNALLGAKHVESILRYFDMHLRIYKRRSVRIHWEDCWQLVFEAFYGEFVLPPHPAITTPVTEMPPPKPRPPLHPLRKVLERRLKRGCIYLILECGHQVDDIFGTLDEPCPKHRRCKECRIVPKRTA